jgi:hypothetical protein
MRFGRTRQHLIAGVVLAALFVALSHVAGFAHPWLPLVFVFLFVPGGIGADFAKLKFAAVARIALLVAIVNGALTMLLLAILSAFKATDMETFAAFGAFVVAAYFAMVLLSWSSERRNPTAQSR